MEMVSINNPYRYMSIVASMFTPVFKHTINIFRIFCE